MYRIYWISEAGTTGNGEPISYELAIAWTEHLQKKYPGMKHWIEKDYTLDNRIL